jgi:hypothetical protein
MAFIDEFGDALAELEDPDLVSTSFTWNGASYPCFASKASQGAILKQFGYETVDNVTILVRGAVFPEGSIPHRGHRITLEGDEHLIDSVQPGPSNVFLRLMCVSPNRGA